MPIRCGSMWLLGLVCGVAACGRADAGADSLRVWPAVAGSDSGGPVDVEPGLAVPSIVARISAIDSAEIAPARVAERRARSDLVKTFARRVRTDYASLQQAVDSMVRAKNIVSSPPPQNDDRLRRGRAATTLDSLDRRAFDAAYMAAEVPALEYEADVLMQLAGSLRAPDLRTLVDGAVVTTRESLESAREVQSQLVPGDTPGRPRGGR